MSKKTESDGVIYDTYEAWQYLDQLDAAVAQGRLRRDQRDTERARIMWMMQNGQIPEPQSRSSRVLAIILTIAFFAIGLGMWGGIGPSIISVLCLVLGIVGLVKIVTSK